MDAGYKCKCINTLKNVKNWMIWHRHIEEYSTFNPIILFHSPQNSTILIKSTQNAVTTSVALLKAIHCHCQKC